VDDLKKQAKELGIKVDKSWSDQRLQAEIDEKLAAAPESEVVAQPVVETVAETPAVEPEPAVEAEAATDPVEPEPEPEVDLALANAEIQAEIETRAPADGRESEEPTEAVDPVENSITVTNLKVNPMKVLGLSSYGSAVFTERQLDADPRLYAKIKRGVDLGILKVDQ
jgi:hypothetical protein